MIQETQSIEEIRAVAKHLAPMPATNVLRWAIEEFGTTLAVVTAFGPEGMVVLDLLAGLGRLPRVLTLDTGRLPEETYELIERTRSRYGVTVECIGPDATRVTDLVRAHGPNLFYKSVALREACCRVRKVDPLRQALVGLAAWIAGLRRGQGPTRADVAKVEVDAVNGGLIKISPLADWSREDVWSYIRAHDVPYNALHDRGYPSIGCEPCTRAVRPGEDERAGRWWWESSERRECGLHGPPRA